MMKVLVLLLTVHTVHACLSNRRSRDQSDLGKILVRGRWLVDSDGRVRLFHGFNSVRKSPPWLDNQILNETRLQYFKEWGFNAVRLGAMWSGVEPTKGQYDNNYIEMLRKAVEKLKSYGMYSLLDMHQDQFSSLFKAYDGIPLWLTKSFPAAEHQFPWPLDAVGRFDPKTYLTEACGKAFQDLYDNVAGGREALVKFWAKIAESFKNYTSVIGYELINEPWAGDIYTYPDLLLPSNAGGRNLLPMYNEINAAVRKIDNHTLIFYEPVTWGVWFRGQKFGTGFDSVPGGPAYANKSVLSWHYYCWLLTPGQAQSRPYSLLLRLACDGILGTSVFENILPDIERTGGSSFMTEFGICETNSYQNSTGNIECNYIMDMADKYLQSWTYWDTWIYFTKDGHVNLTAADAFVRPYARATAGVPKKMKFERRSKVFELDYFADPNIHAPTEIFIPKLQYPEGIAVEASEHLAWSFDEETDLLLVKLNENRVRDSGSVSSSVVVRRKT